MVFWAKAPPAVRKARAATERRRDFFRLGVMGISGKCLMK
jgi:hypothetical protein